MKNIKLTTNKMSWFKGQRFNKKKPKERIEKLYTNNVSLSSLTKYDSEFYQFAMIDPGPSSCAVRIERLYLKTKERRVIYFGILFFGKTAMEINKNMNDSFKNIKHLLKECHHICFEHQLAENELIYQYFGAMIYYVTVKICTKGFKPNILEIDVALKTTYLGGPKTKKQNNGESIKLWSKKYALNQSLKENDYVSYNILKYYTGKGKEDLSDVKCYCVSWPKFVTEKESIIVPFKKKLLNSFF